MNSKQCYKHFIMSAKSTSLTACPKRDSGEKSTENSYYAAAKTSLSQITLLDTRIMFFTVRSIDKPVAYSVAVNYRQLYTQPM